MTEQRQIADYVVRRPLRCLLGRHRWVRMDTTWIMHRCSECQKERVWLP